MSFELANPLNVAFKLRWIRSRASDWIRWSIREVPL